MPLLSGSRSGSAPLAVGDGAPAWVATRLDGSDVSSEGFEGHILILAAVDLPSAAARARMASMLAARLECASGARASALLLSTGSVEDARALQAAVPQLDVCLDPDGAITREFAPPGFAALAVVDRGGRVAALVPRVDKPAHVDRVLDVVRLLRAAYPAGPAAMHAPVLQIPRALSAETCKQIVHHWHKAGAVEGTVSRTVNGVSENVSIPDYKRRKDAYLTDRQQELVAAELFPRLQTEVWRAFQFEVTHYEYLQVGCYDAQDKGFFRAHRDNKNAGNDHWRFAMSLNLNDDYDGGGIRFLEYGDAPYRPALGDAVIFSCGLLHEATAVTRGRRFVLLSFLYGDADAERAILRGASGGFQVRGPRRDEDDPEGL